MPVAVASTANSATLRAELKDWERAFAAANGGRKADRNDIKKDSTIGMATFVLYRKFSTADPPISCQI